MWGFQRWQGQGLLESIFAPVPTTGSTVFSPSSSWPEKPDCTARRWRLASGFGRLQIIVTDHAKFDDDPEFVNHIKDDWWQGGALIPEEWIGTPG
jgi:hypothetical protein